MLEEEKSITIDFFAIGTERCPGIVPTPHLTGEKASFGGVLHSFVSQLTLLYNLLDSLLHFTICGTACSSIQFVGQLALPYNLWDRPGLPVLQNNICYTYPLLARFHFMFYQYCKH